MELKKADVQRIIATEIIALFPGETLYGEGKVRPDLSTLRKVLEVSIDFSADKAVTANVMREGKVITRHYGKLVVTAGVPNGTGVDFLLKSVDAVESKFLGFTKDRVMFLVPTSSPRTQLASWLFQQVTVPFYFDRFPLSGG